VQKITLPFASLFPGCFTISLIFLSQRMFQKKKGPLLGR